MISAPVIGGALGLTVRDPRPAEHRRDVLAVEDVPPPVLLAIPSAAAIQIILREWWSAKGLKAPGLGADEGPTR